MAEPKTLSTPEVLALAVGQWGAATERIQSPLGPGISRLYLLADVFTEIAWLESNFQYEIVNPTGHAGLWQISPLHTAGLRKDGIIRHPSDLLKPSTNAAAARWVYNKQGLKAWTTMDQALENIANDKAHRDGAPPLQAQETPTIIDSLPNPLGWTDALGKFFGALVDPQFWKRVGLGALGAAVIVAALILWNKDEIQESLP